MATLQYSAPTSNPNRLTQAPDLFLNLADINGQEYRVSTLVITGAAKVVRLSKLADGKTYHVTQVNASLTVCECPDCTYRKRACKHIQAVQALWLLEKS